MKKLMKKIFYSVLVLMVLIICIISFFLTTTPGLYTAIRIAKLYIPGSLSVSSLEGRLLDKFSIGTLTYEYENIQMHIDRLQVHWVFSELIHKKLPISDIQAQSIIITTEHTSNTFNQVTLQGQITPQFTTIDKIQFDYLHQLIEGTLNIANQYPHALSGNLRHDALPLQVKVGLGGDLTQIHWSGTISGAATGTIEGTLKQGNDFYQLVKWLNLHWRVDQDKTLIFPEGRVKSAGFLPNLTTELTTKILTSEASKWQVNTKIHATVDTQNTGKNLIGKGSLMLDNNIKLNLHFDLPKYDVGQGAFSKHPISAELNLSLNSLELFKELNPEIKNLKGRLEASIKARGTFAQPNLTGELKLYQTSCQLPNLGLKIDAIDMLLLSKNNAWQANGTINSAGSKLYLKGQGPLSQEFTGAFTIQGENFPVMQTKEYQIKASPQLNLKIDPNSVQISGSILVPYAKIMPQSFTNSLTLSDDVVYAQQQQALQTSDQDTSMRVRVEMGKDVELTYKGLRTSLAGVIDLKQDPQGPINGNGELRVIKGEYKAYGQDLAIDQGQLIFTGGSLNNPGINLRASKKISNENMTSITSVPVFDNNINLTSNAAGSNIRVGVEVTGRLTAPKVQLFSNPAILSQADILSMLVLGRPASQANKAGGQLLLAAISSMDTGSNTSQLLEQLKQKLGFDLNVQTVTNYNQTTNQFNDTTSLVVGKSLSKRLYLSYNVGLSQADPNVTTLKYIISKFLSIQVNSSVSANGVDFLYTRSSKDKKHERAHHTS